MKPSAWFRSRTQAPIADESLLAFRTAAAEAQRSRLPQMAAALSYRTIFGLIPTLVVALLILGQVVAQDDLADVIKRAMNYAGLQNISVSGEIASDPGMGPPVERTLDQWVAMLISRARTGISAGAIGLVGFVILIYAAVTMLVEIERAFNQIYRVPRGRSWFRRVVNYWTLLTLGGIGLAATFYVGARFQLWAKDVVESQGLGVGTGAATIQVIGYLVTVAISTAMLTLVYATVPNTRVRAVAALVGAVIAALLWEAGKWGFGQYIEYSTGYAKLYGSLALVPLFLLWVYYTWLIVLFGLAVTYQFQHGRNKTSPQPLHDFGPTIIEPSACLLVMASMARAMAIGTPQSIKAIGLSTGLSEPVVTIIVSRFAERGLLLRVEREGESVDVQYALARNPSMIRVGEVLSLGFELAGGPESNPVVERMRRAQIDAAGAETLADISGKPGEPRKKPAPAGAFPTPAAAPSAPPAPRTDGPTPSRAATL